MLRPLQKDVKLQRFIHKSHILNPNSKVFDLSLHDLHPPPLTPHLSLSLSLESQQVHKKRESEAPGSLCVSAQRRCSGRRVKGPSEPLVFHLQPNADAFATSSHNRGRDLQLSEPGSLKASKTIHHLTPEINKPGCVN